MDDDSDSESSDIGNLLLKAHEKKMNQQAIDDSAYDDDDSDDDDLEDEEDDLPGEEQTPKRNVRSSTRLKRGLGDESLPGKRQTTTPLSDGDKSDDSDDDYDDDDAAAATLNQTGTDPAATSDVKRPKRLPVIDLASSSDDEDYNAHFRRGGAAAAAPTPSISDLRLKGADQQSLDELQNAKVAVENLQRAQRASNLRQFEESQVDLTETHIPTTAVQYMQLVICPRLDDHQATGAAAPNVMARPAAVTLPDQVVVAIFNDKTVQNLIEAFLAQAKLTSDKYTVGLQFNGQVLDPKRTLCKIPQLEPSSHMDAIVYRSTIGLSMSSSSCSAANNKNKNKNNSSSSNLGPAIHVKLRDEAGHDISMPIHLKEAFVELVEPYRSLKNLAPGKKILLLFDGEQLRPVDTPQSLDVEEGDMIEVRVR